MLNNWFWKCKWIFSIFLSINIWRRYLSFFFLFYFFSFKKFKFSGLWLNQSCSCWPMPQPQQHRIRVASVTYIAARGMPDPLTHWVRSGIKPASSFKLVGFLIRRATVGTPEEDIYLEARLCLVIIKSYGITDFFFFLIPHIKA